MAMGRRMKQRQENRVLDCAHRVAGGLKTSQRDHHTPSYVNRTILPALNRCQHCAKTESGHKEATHDFERDERIPKWQGWHAARRGLGSNLYRLGVSDMVILRILRHANVSTTATYYIKTAAAAVKHAMEKLENNIPQAREIVRDTFGTPEPSKTNSEPTIQ
jgi:integrase